jgi:hypothetical protein
MSKGSTLADRLPAAVWIAGHRFTVAVRQLPPHHYGRADAQTGELIFSPDCCESFIREVALHEIVHQIDFLLADGFLSASMRQRCKTFPFQEPVVVFLSRALYMTFTDPRNAEFARWLWGESEQ